LACGVLGYLGVLMRKLHYKWIATVLFALLLAACGSESGMDHSGMDMSNQASTTELDESLSKMSEAGVFMVELRPMQEPIPLNEILTWELHVQDAAGQAVEDATITIGGGMPEHNHGFPTEPTVTESEEAGVYLVEGIKYQMSGWWEMSFQIATDSQADSVMFNIVLP
jgi:hypothetical protein